VVSRTEELWFGPGDPVRAASGLAPLGDGWLVAQDDANHAARWDRRGIRRLRLFPPVDGHDLFGAAAGTKHLKPDLEAACAVTAAGGPAVLLLGSGSSPLRTRAALVVDDGGPRVHTADLAPLYAAAATALGLEAADLNLEGACLVGDRLRWFQRGHGRSRLPSASVDLDAGAVVAAVLGEGDPAGLVPTDPRRYDLGRLGGLPLTITDAVALADDRVLVAAAAEDAPDAITDGPVVGSALAVVDEDESVAAVAPVEADGPAWKIEGLALRGQSADGAVSVLAVTDQDDPRVPSLAVELTLRW
jgi:hypothetical protein